MPAPTPSEYRINPDNPYALHNVRQALKLVRGANAPSLKPTHHYVRFLPQDTTHMYILIDSLDLDIYPYPRDWMLNKEEREAYKNAEINGFPWYYCLLEPDFQMPTEMESEFLDYAYVQPYITGNSSKSSSSISGRSYQLSSEVFAEVLDRSIEITGNAAAQARTRAVALTPDAIITYVSGDEADPNPIPLRNVRVRGNWYFGSAESYTNVNGEAILFGLPSDDVHHLIIWAYDGKWKIREHKNYDKVKTEENGRSSGMWELQIGDNNPDVNTTDEMWATIHRALDAYYFGSYPKAAGLAKWDKSDDLDVWARYGESNFKDNSYVYGTFGSDGTTDLTVWSHDSSVISNTKMLGVMFHELGHASHAEAAGIGNYNSSSSQLSETWACGVQYAYMSSIYPNSYAGYIGYTAIYTAIIESLMWQGLSLQQLQTAFMGKLQLSECISSVKNLPNTPDGLIDKIFDDAF